ncbi:MAG TPA: sigma-70 family RNA polymerase sigma factor [Gemmataceae bacterium]|nr:sigma-70 family RNA polymerase sigma factor [Gemmataceae bacterium]
MAPSPLSNYLTHLRGILARREGAEPTDGQLLERYLSERDECAFEMLVRRHGPMVLGVCRRVLGNSHDAEDAFQATFLVLIRRASSISPRDRVGGWLHGVAYRTALEARRSRTRRRRKEAQAVPRTPPPEDAAAEWFPLLDTELNRLPINYRLPLLLCDLEGLTRKQAAQKLGWPEGTLSSRLSRGRELLARRLKRHGLGLSAASAVALAEGAATASVPASLIGPTVKAALLTAAGQTADASIIAAQAVVLMERIVRNMAMLKLKFTAAILLSACIVTGLSYHGLAQQGEPNARKAPDAIAVKVERLGEKKATEPEKKPAVSVKSMPPVVVKTVPQAGDTEVDAGKVKEIRVTFSKDMADEGWSWTQISDETFPNTVGKIHYEKDHRTCVLPVKLETGKTYVIWLNSQKFHNFKDADGHSAVPYLLVFETKAEK